MHLHVCSAVVVPVYGNTPCLYMLAHVAGLPSARANINTQQVQHDTIYIYIYISKAHLCADMHMYDVDVHGPFYMHA